MTAVLAREGGTAEQAVPPVLVTLRRRDGSVSAFVKVDAEMAAELAGRKYYLCRDGYAYRNVSAGKHVAMHREILGLSAGDGLEVDHVNGDKLDNRRANLRVVTRAENAQNVAAKGRSRFRGVSFYPPTGRWKARCQIRGKVHYLGYFNTEEEAGAVAEAFRREHMPFSRN